MSYRIELRNCLIGLQDGFSGSGKISDAAIAADDTTLLIDPSFNVLHDDATVVPVGARFTTAGIDTIRTVTAQNANKTWLITIGADTAGSYTLTFNGQTTTSIAGTDNATAIQAALVALSNVDAGDLIVSGSGPYTVEARGQYLGLATPVMTATPTTLDNFVFAVVQPGNATWSLTFTPAIATGSVPVNADVITFLPQRVFMKTGKGNFEATINKDTIVDTDRGLLDGVRLGDEKSMDVTTSFVLSFLRASSGQPITVFEALNRLGGASTWHNAAADPCEPYAPEIFIIHRPPCGSEQAEVWTFPQFYPNSQGVNISDALVSLKGISVAVEPVITREAGSLYADLFDA